jgi:hypothetical protein
MGVRVLIVLHGQWLARRFDDAFAEFAKAAGVVLYRAEVRPPLSRGLEPTDPPDWQALRAQVDALPRLAAQDADSVPVLGPIATVQTVTLGMNAPTAQAAYRSTQHRLPAGPSPAEAARAVRHTLRDIPQTDWRDPLGGVAAALEAVGYQLRAGAGGQVPTWDDLADLADPVPGAALALYEAGLGADAIARLRLTDTAEDGSWVVADGERVAVSRGGRPHLVALRVLRELIGRHLDGYLFGEERPLDIRRALSRAATHLGMDLGVDDFARRLSPSQAWLALRGLRVVRTERADPIEDRHDPFSRPMSGPSRCGHGLLPTIEVDTVALSHSRKLCGARDPEDVRPPSAGYALTFFESSSSGRTVAVSLDGVAAGWLWEVTTPLGPVWLQAIVAEPPSRQAVADAVHQMQSERPQRPAPRHRLVA